MFPLKNFWCHFWTSTEKFSHFCRNFFDGVFKTAFFVSRRTFSGNSFPQNFSCFMNFGEWTEKIGFSAIPGGHMKILRTIIFSIGIFFCHFGNLIEIFLTLWRIFPGMVANTAYYVSIESFGMKNSFWRKKIMSSPDTQRKVFKFFRT